MNFDENMKLIDRLKKIIDIKADGIVTRFERKCGISNGTLQKAVQNNTQPSLKTLEKIFIAFPDINKSWLLNEEGDMFKKYSKDKGCNDKDTVNEPDAGYDTRNDIIRIYGALMNMQEKYQEMNRKLDYIESLLRAKNPETVKPPG